jgi:hypothetical protein
VNNLSLNLNKTRYIQFATKAKIPDRSIINDNSKSIGNSFWM